MHDTSVSQDEAARLILRDAALLDGVRAAAPALEALVQPAGAAGVVEVLAPLMTVFNVDEKVATEAFWEIYVRTLKDIPAAALQAAVQAYVAKPASQWFPKPGELLKLSRSANLPVFMEVGRIRRVLSMAAGRERA